MLLGVDMVDLVSEERIVLVQPAVLAAAIGSLSDIEQIVEGRAGTSVVPDCSEGEGDG